MERKLPVVQVWLREALGLVGLVLQAVLVRAAHRQGQAVGDSRPAPVFLQEVQEQWVALRPRHHHPLNTTQLDV